jgi:hypothetical protein
LMIPRRMVCRSSTGISIAGLKPVRNQPDDNSVFRHMLTIQCQKRIIDITFILMYPSQQFSLDINCSPSRMILVQCSSTRSYKIINPELSVTIFDTILSLLILYILGDTQTG